MSYHLKLSRTAEKQLAKIESKDRVRLVTSVRELSSNPRPHGAIKLSNRDAWRIRVGSYRVIYEIKDQELLVLIIEVGHRGDIYRSL